MKKSKIILFLAMLVFALNYSYSQKIFLEEGYVQHKMTTSAFDTKYVHYYHGNKMGFNVQIDFKHNLSLLSGVLYSVVYSSASLNFPSGMDIEGVDTTSFSGAVSTSTFGLSLDVPVRAKYTIKLAKDVNIFAFAGPNLNIGLAMPRHTDASLSTDVNAYIKEQLGYEFNSGTEDLYKEALIHRINFQLGAGGGIQWKNYQLKAGYDFGINNLNRKKIYDLYNSGWWASLAYQF